MAAVLGSPLCVCASVVPVPMGPVARWWWWSDTSPQARKGEFVSVCVSVYGWLAECVKGTRLFVGIYVVTQPPKADRITMQTSVCAERDLPTQSLSFFSLSL